MATPLGMPKPRSMDPEERDLDTTGRPATPALVDSFGRSATDLRVSLTDFCNLRCTYCMPESGLQFLKRQQLMNVDEVVRFVRIAVEHLGIEQVRFTGGEPLTRNDLADIIAGVAAIDPKPDISLTTNAIGLDKRAESLVAAGLDRINISLDSVHSETFETMTRRPLLHRVLEGIDGSVAAGLSPIKINAVLQPGVNEYEAPELLRWCLERGFELRFIEYMPLDGAGKWTRERMITARDVWKLLAPHYVLSPVNEPRNGAPAELFNVWARPGARQPGNPGTAARHHRESASAESLTVLPDVPAPENPLDSRGAPVHGEPPHAELQHGEPPHSEPQHGEPPHSEPQHGEPSHGEPLGRVGIIASVTRPFCADCTRTRLTAEGRVRTCLFSHTETDLLTLMRSNATDQEIADRWRAAQWGKQAGHGMNRDDFVQPDRPMSAIGG